MILGQKYLLSLFYRILRCALHYKKKKKKASVNRNPDFSRCPPPPTHTHVWFLEQRIALLDCLESFSVGGGAPQP